MGPLVLIAVCLLCSSIHVGMAQEPNGCNSSTPILITESGTCSEIPHPDNFSIITDSTSYFVTVPLNELSNEFILQQFTIFFSPNVLTPADNQPNIFVFLIQETGDAGALSFFVVEPAVYFLQDSTTVINETIALVFTGEEGDLAIGTYPFTLNVNPFEEAPFPITNVTINVVEAPDPCVSDPCVNGICNRSDDSNLLYVCSCFAGYTGADCEIELDPCDSTPCKNGGSCTKVTPIEFSCNCSEGYTGDICTVNIDDCEGVFCGNGACVDELNGYYCDCDSGYDKDVMGNCTVDIDDCASDPCENGLCQDEVNGFTCNCYPGYTGTTCDEDINDCEPNPCDIHGFNSLMDGNQTCFCKCRSGYTGELCDININDCDPNLCLNNATCEDGIASYICLCPYGYTDKNCETVVNFCEDDPCNNGTCTSMEAIGYKCDCNPGYTGVNCSIDIDECAVDPCGPGTATCVDGIDAFTCLCQPQFTGTLCDIRMMNCDDSPCKNNATCTNADGGFVCNCPPDYTGMTCEEKINDCALTPCLNGECIDGIMSFMCVCETGFTGSLCEVDINFCELQNPCLNGGSCIDLELLNYNCTCADGYFGTNCSEDLSVCTENAPCQNDGNCTDGPGLDYTCSCPGGFEGGNCENDIDVCDLSPCNNNGNCTDGYGLEFNCTCFEGFEGETCDIDVDACLCDPCQNYGNCTDGPGLNYTCSCPDGFEGDNCENDVDVCDLNTCSNNGNCTEAYGLAFNCTCNEGFEGQTCDIDVDACLFDPCQNGGSCQDLPGPGLSFNCSCEPGFAGLNCSVDLQFCNESYCQNGGTCVDGIGTAISCSCSIDYTGDNCETELTFCTSNVCMNGGTCMEDAGNQTYCVCVEGFEGDFCNMDRNYCNSTTCKNNGTCVEGFGVETSCSCLSGFNGDICENDLNFCTENTCSNGGICLEGYGNITTCQCPDIYTGDYCQTPFCPEGYCNNGTCNNSTDPVSCQCFPGYKGEQCQVDIDFCVTLPCMNGGTCVDGSGIFRTCYCPPTFTGEDCEIPVCQDDSCDNGGTCLVEDGELTCTCPFGFSGPSCENDLDFCNSSTCLNEGTCVEGYGKETSCNCSYGFDGVFCEEDLDFCTKDTCTNGGTCEEEYGPMTICLCPEIYTGDQCQTPFCPLDYCNNGTCDGNVDPVNCNCFPGYMGDRCEIDINYCAIEPCQNGGTCFDGSNTSRTCYCPPNFTGPSCETPVCQQDSCENGGTCLVEGTTLTCHCPEGFTGPTCGTGIINVCDSNPCVNGGSCSEAEGATFSCVCPDNFTGLTCETPICTVDSCSNGGVCEVQGNAVVCTCLPNYTGATCNTYLPCSPNQCLNGGTCIVNSTDNSFSCECAEGYLGDFCQTPFSTECTQDSDCVDGYFCSITCASDSYPPHSVLLRESINLQGISYVNVEASMHPDFSGDITVFIVFKQDVNNQGYLLFYGTSGNDRNFAILLNNDTELTFFYLTINGTRNDIKIETNWNKFERHFLTVSIDISANFALFYLDDADVIVRILDNPDFTALVSDTKPASLLVGARLPHHYRFSGQIEQVIFFPSVVPSNFPLTLRFEFDSLVSPSGECTSYLQYGDSCPTPTTALSPLCVSAMDKCDPTLKCLIPSPGSPYLCQPVPASCTRDADCSTGYFCGSELPSGGSNYFQTSEFSLPGESHFLLEPTMQFNGEQIVSLSADFQPQISSELTIFAVVTQDENNDGYVVGKGLNDRMRDFGLYLRSSKNTVWLAYGADEEGEGFREILFFYNVNIADGMAHTIGAVISGAANRAVLYIDGKAVSQQSPLPSMPTFRPGYNLLYVGGRPGTKRFRLKGTISNLLVSTAPLQPDSIEVLHSDAMDSDGRLNLQPPTSRFCRKYISPGSQCELVNGDVINNFRCSSPSECVPIQDSSSARVLPDVNTQYSVLGRCITPCDCSDQPESLVCGSDGNTYANSCYRECAQVTEVHTGACA